MQRGERSPDQDRDQQREHDDVLQRAALKGGEAFENDVSGSVRTPSGPKNSRPRPTSAKCSATEIVSSSSTVPSATGRNTIRSSRGAIGVISIRASRSLTASGGSARIASQAAPTAA